MGRDAKITSIDGKITFADGREAEFHLFTTGGDWSWRQGGIDAHILGQRATGDILDSLAKAVDEHQTDNLPSHHWHVTVTDEAVQCFDTPEEAKEALHDLLAEALDELPECDDALYPSAGGRTVMCTPCMAHRHIAAVLDDEDNWDLSERFSATVSNGSGLPVDLLVERVDADSCEVDDD